jgi:signal transduction histidine kinase
MLGVAQLEPSSTLLISVAAAIVGFAAYWSNPRRAVNRAFFGASLHVALWLACLDQAMKGGPNGQFWMRTTSVVGAFIVVSMWLIKEAILDDGIGSRSLKKIERLFFYVGAAGLAGIVFTKWFVAPRNPSLPPKYLLGYNFYMVGSVLLYCVLFLIAWRQMRRAQGVSKLELQVVLLGGSFFGLTVLAMMAVRGLLNQPALVRMQPVVVLGFYVFTVFFITTGKVFSTRQLVALCFKRSAAWIAGFAVAGIAASVFTHYLNVFLSAILATALSILTLQLSRPWFDKILRNYTDAENVRKAVVLAARHERAAEKLEDEFVKILKSWGSSDRAMLLAEDSKATNLSDSKCNRNDDILRAMGKMRWATPERLSREREGPDSTLIKSFLCEKQLGLLVFEEGIALRILIGIGPSLSRKPYTFPQVSELMELAPLIESLMERAHFSEKIRRTEQLATVGLLGASLAHEIRNPLVSIKAFSQLLPIHYQDLEFRAKFFKIINEEVQRIEELTDQLMDLAAPRAYVEQLIDLHELLRSSIDLLSTKAGMRGIQLKTDFGAERSKVVTDPHALRQVILNLCFNAIQAFDSHSHLDRWVCVSTKNLGSSVELSVSDNGPGVSPDILPRIFEPFQTTKSSGFGLGLAVCRDILVRLRSSISVDAPEIGKGATFRVLFPSQ